MTSYVQETDSKMIFYYHSREPLKIYPSQQNETISKESDLYYRTIPTELNLISNSLDKINTLYNAIIRDYAKSILNIIQKQLTQFYYLGFDLCKLPKLEVFNYDNNTILIEWIFDDFRIGFSIEQDLEKSSWYLVSNANLGEINACGYLSNDQDDKIIMWMINFILSR